MEMTMVPVFYFVAAFMILLVAILVVLVKILNVLKSFRPDQKEVRQKDRINNLNFRDLR